MDHDSADESTADQGAIATKTYGPGSDGWASGHLQFIANDQLLDIKLLPRNLMLSHP